MKRGEVSRRRKRFGEMLFHESISLGCKLHRPLCWLVSETQYQSGNTFGRVFVGLMPLKHLGWCTGPSGLLGGCTPTVLLQERKEAFLAYRFALQYYRSRVSSQLPCCYKLCVFALLLLSLHSEPSGHHCSMVEPLPIRTIQYHISRQEFDTTPFSLSLKVALRACPS
jgi:hypothetical protein